MDILILNLQTEALFCTSIEPTTDGAIISYQAATYKTQTITVNYLRRINTSSELATDGGITTYQKIIDLA